MVKTPLIILLLSLSGPASDGEEVDDNLDEEPMATTDNGGTKNTDHRAREGPEKTPTDGSDRMSSGDATDPPACTDKCEDGLEKQDTEDDCVTVTARDAEESHLLQGGNHLTRFASHRGKGGTTSMAVEGRPEPTAAAAGMGDDGRMSMAAGPRRAINYTSKGDEDDEVTLRGAYRARRILLREP